MVGKDLDFEGLDPLDKGIFEAINRANEAYMSDRRQRRLEVHPRANEAKEDYLNTIPGSLYKLMRDDIARVWGLLESPIEQVAIFQLASENYGRSDWPIYAKVARERGMHSHRHYPVQIIPQITFERYRVDFLFDLGSRALYAIECDGEEFHQDWKKDQQRDLRLLEHHGVTVLRITGKQLWRDNTAAHYFADIIRLYMK